MTFRKWMVTGVTALGAFAVASSAPARADGEYRGRYLRDAPTYVAAPMWQGFYIGANVGGAWNDISNDQTVFLTPPIPPAAFRVGDLSGSGVFGGLQFGYNWQSGNCCYVFGIEGDFGGMDNSNNNHIQTQLTGPGTDTAFRVRGSGGLYGDITGRLGYIWGESLFYAKGGFAWWAPSLEARETVLVNGDPLFVADHHNDNNILGGWTVGFGVEYMLSPSWTFKLEYLHFDFGSGSDSNCCADGLNNIHFFGSDITVETVKVGFNYMIHPPIAALK